jgi:hypothetical protein
MRTQLRVLPAFKASTLLSLRAAYILCIRPERRGLLYMNCGINHQGRE